MATPSARARRGNLGPAFARFKEPGVASVVGLGNLVDDGTVITAEDRKDAGLGIDGAVDITALGRRGRVGERAGIGFVGAAIIIATAPQRERHGQCTNNFEPHEPE